VYFVVKVLKRIIGDGPLFDFRFLSDRLLIMVLNMNTQALTCAATAGKILLTHIVSHELRGAGKPKNNSRLQNGGPYVDAAGVSFGHPHGR